MSGADEFDIDDWRESATYAVWLEWETNPFTDRTWE